MWLFLLCLIIIDIIGEGMEFRTLLIAFGVLFGASQVHLVHMFSWKWRVLEIWAVHWSICLDMLLHLLLILLILLPFVLLFFKFTDVSVDYTIALSYLGSYPGVFWVLLDAWVGAVDIKCSCSCLFYLVQISCYNGTFRWVQRFNIYCSFLDTDVIWR